MLRVDRVGWFQGISLYMHPIDCWRALLIHHSSRGLWAVQFELNHLRSDVIVAEHPASKPAPKSKPKLPQSRFEECLREDLEVATRLAERPLVEKLNYTPTATAAKALPNPNLTQRNSC